MSNGPDKLNTLFEASASLNAAHLVLLDGRDHIVVEGHGHLSASLPIGLYTLRTEISGRISEHMFRHGVEGTRIDDLELNMPYSSTPIQGMLGAHNYYRSFANRWSKEMTEQEPISANPGQASQLLILIRFPSRDAFAKQRGILPDPKLFSLRNEAGPLALLENQNTRKDNENGAMAFSMKLAPGMAYLNYAGSEPRELCFPLAPDWQTQIFLTCNPEPDWRTLRVHFTRPEHGIQNAEEDVMLSELALDQLQITKAQLPRERMNMLLEGKFEQPLFGFLGLYICLLQRDKLDERLVQTVLRNMQERILNLPDCPDLVILQWLAQYRLSRPIEPLEPLTHPPLFKAGMDFLVELSADYPELIPDNDLFERIVLEGFADSPFNTWKGTSKLEFRNAGLKGIETILYQDFADFEAESAKELVARDSADEIYKYVSESKPYYGGPEPTWLQKGITYQLLQHSEKGRVQLSNLSRQVGAPPRLVKSAMEDIRKDRGLMNVLLDRSRSILGDALVTKGENELHALMARLLGDNIVQTDYPLTDYHAKYLAYALTRRVADNSPEKFTRTFADARIEPKPHQVEAALFGYKATLMNQGAILADEVGLGKTIEAGLVIAQKWAEGRKRIMVIAPSSLRKQWQAELKEKFFLDSIVLESGKFKELKQNFPHKNPFQQDCIIISSYHFVRSKSEEIRALNWDLAVIDEAHRLRNAHRPSNVLASSVKETLSGVPKLLLTATPLQNNLLELYGLVSMLDEHAFGDLRSFKAQYTRIKDEEQPNFQELKERLNPYCVRSLRQDVQPYVRYTNRVAVLEKYQASDDEQRLYDLVSEYLRKPALHALPTGQRHLITLIARKLLASSTAAIIGTLESLIKRLTGILEGDEEASSTGISLAADMPDTFDDLEEEWEETEEAESEEDLEDEEPQNMDVPDQTIEEEIAELQGYLDLANSITEHSKASALLEGLNIALDKANELGAKRKALIFTESMRTQAFLYDYLCENGYEDEVITFNGTNNEQHSRAIYQRWKNANKDTDRVTKSGTVDRRTAILDEFASDRCTIMIATEAGSEGVNMQFCSLVVNYDLPWNPQRIEQRIGRCHRYGQQHDVVVLNFLNERNAADRRVFELLNDKFQLFEGLFGASDEVLGSIANGVDIEKRIAEIYQNCRSQDEIEAEFNVLQRHLEAQINREMKDVRNKLITHFDDQVIERLRLVEEESKDYLNQYEKWLWELTRHLLGRQAEFSADNHVFQLKSKEGLSDELALTQYHLKDAPEEGVRYRPGHPLAATLIDRAKSMELAPAELRFDLSQHQGNVSILQSLKGQKGYLRLSQVTIESYQDSDHLLFTGYTAAGEELTQEQCERLFTLPSSIAQSEIVLNGQSEKLSGMFKQRKEKLNISLKAKDTEILKEQSIKLEKWAEDQKLSAKKELEEAAKKTKNLQTKLPDAKDSEEILEIQQALRAARVLWRKHQQEIFDREIKIEEQQDELINNIRERLQQHVTEEELFSIGWEVV